MEKISRVTRSNADAKASYNRMSQRYDITTIGLPYEDNLFDSKNDIIITNYLK